jgi:hypothetical protein
MVSELLRVEMGLTIMEAEAGMYHGAVILASKVLKVEVEVI